MTVDQLIALLTELSEDGRGACAVECCDWEGNILDVCDIEVSRLLHGPRKGSDVVRILS